MKKSFFSKIKWIFEVSRRFSRVERKGRSAATSRLAIAGICAGVMTLIVVMSIMNGFQLSSIEPILEISSYHVRAENISQNDELRLVELCKSNKSADCITSFYEAQTLMTGTRGRESAAIIRAVDPSIIQNDRGFAEELKIIRGDFEMSQEDSIVLGSSLANALGAAPGSKVNLLVLSGGSDVNLISDDRIFTVTGIFSCGYSEINSSYAFVNIDSAEKYFGADSKKIWGIKLKNSSDDMHIISQLKKEFPDSSISSWREYNKSFYGALRLEKNILLMLVLLIFAVVAINIYNGMRRLVFERRNEIAILSAVGAEKSEVKSIFVMRGFIIGFSGAMIGLFLGLLISFNTDFIFLLLSKIMYFFQYIGTAISNPQNLPYIQENSSYLLYSQIPARIFVREVVMITLFGIISPVLASYAASKNVLKMTVAEVLHHE